MKLFSIALSLFLLMDALGNIPLYISFLKKVPLKRKVHVIFREMLIALGVMIVFALMGEALMSFLNISHYAIKIAGGVILFLLCLRMVFPPPKDESAWMPHDKEPFVVPLAIPFVAGPAVLAAVMIYVNQDHLWIVVGAIFLAWVVSLAILLCCSFLTRHLGWRGIVALERLMGLLMVLIAVEMFLDGVRSFAQQL